MKSAIAAISSRTNAPIQRRGAGIARQPWRGVGVGADVGAALDRDGRDPAARRAGGGSRRGPGAPPGEGLALGAGMRTKRITSPMASAKGWVIALHPREQGKC